MHLTPLVLILPALVTASLCRWAAPSLAFPGHIWESIALSSGAEVDPISRWSRIWTLRAFPMWDSLVGIQGGNPLGDGSYTTWARCQGSSVLYCIQHSAFVQYPLLRSGELVWSLLSSHVRSWYPGVYSEYMLHSFGGMMRYQVTNRGGDGKSRPISVLCGLSAPSELTSKTTSRK